MKILADYHTHTVYSNGKKQRFHHGKGTIEENVKVAISKGLKRVGISDHGFRHVIYGVDRNYVSVIREEIDRLNEKYKEIEILFGMECNILDREGNIDMIDSLRDKFDYVMAGYHFGSIPSGFGSLMNHLSNCTISTSKTKRYNTDAIVNAIKKNDLYIITHPGDKGDIYIEEVAKAAKNRNVMLEINGHHGKLSVDQLKKIETIGNKFVLGSDAHRPENVANFDKGIEIVKKSGIDFSRIDNIEI